MTIYYIVRGFADDEQARLALNFYLHDTFERYMLNVLAGKLQQQMIASIEQFRT